MKVSISLPADDVEFIDDYARHHGIRSRSAALHRAVRLLRAEQLEQAYVAAWDEWTDSGEAESWETATADGLSR